MHKIELSPITYSPQPPLDKKLSLFALLKRRDREVAEQAPPLRHAHVKRADNITYSLMQSQQARRNVYHGVRHFDDGRIYVGMIFLNKPHGKGQMTFPDGTVFEGNFFLGGLNGIGRIFYPNGDIYEGQIVEWKRHGEGSLISLKFRQDGSWLDDKPFTNITKDLKTIKA